MNKFTRVCLTLPLMAFAILPARAQVTVDVAKDLLYLASRDTGTIYSVAASTSGLSFLTALDTTTTWALAMLSAR